MSGSLPTAGSGSKPRNSGCLQDKQGTSLRYRRKRGRHSDHRRPCGSAERQKGWSQGVQVAALRTSGQIPLIDQVFEKKATTHGPSRLLSVMTHLPESIFGEALTCLVQQLRSHSEVELCADDVNEIGRASCRERV